MYFSFSQGKHVAMSLQPVFYQTYFCYCSATRAQFGLVDVTCLRSLRDNWFDHPNIRRFIVENTYIRDAYQTTYTTSIRLTKLPVLFKSIQVQYRSKAFRKRLVTQPIMVNNLRYLSNKAPLPKACMPRTGPTRSLLSNSIRRKANLIEKGTIVCAFHFTAPRNLASCGCFTTDYIIAFIELCCGCFCFNFLLAL